MNLNKLATAALAIGAVYVRDKLIESPIGGLISEVEEMMSYVETSKVISLDEVNTYKDEFKNYTQDELEWIEDCFEDEYENYYDCYEEDNNDQIVVRKLFKNR